MKSTIDATRSTRPCVLIVDDEPALHELVNDVVRGNKTDSQNAIDCQLVSSLTLVEAKRAIEQTPIQLVLLDVNLPDGDGMSIVDSVREKNPNAEIVVMTGQPTVDRAVGALRAGVIDFLAKPFTVDQLRQHLVSALKRQTLTAHIDKRLSRLRSAVRRLNISRRMVSKKVDLLCNDLISAYSALSRQVDTVRTQESFRKLADSAKDLEQLLCHAMDWILRHAGYSNVAVWLAADDGVCELGAYMKYTIAGEKDFTEAMKESLLPIVQREGFVHLGADELKTALGETEAKYLEGQTVIAANCTYLGETLASIVAFRDARSPFTDDDDAMMKTISPIFAVALASIVRKQHPDIDDLDGGIDGDGYVDGDNDNEQSPFYDDTTGGDKSPPPARDEDEDRDRKNRKKRERDQEKKDRHAADWWKRGEPPPF